MKPSKHKLYNQFFESVRDVLYVLDPQGTFLQLSPSFERILGWPTEDWLGKNFRDLIHPEDLPKAVSAFTTNLSGGVVDTYVLRVKSRKGTYKVAEITSTPLLEQERVVGVIGIARDVTDRQQLMDALRASEENYRLTIQNIDEVAYAVDTTDDPYQGKVHFVSERVKEILGYDAQEFLDDRALWWRIIHPDDRSAVTQAAQRLLTDGQPIVRVYRLRHKLTGEYRWFEDRSAAKVDAAGKVVGMFGAARDITERIRTEQALQEQQRMLSTLMSNLPGMIYRCKNDADWTITFVSEGSFELTGYRPDELVNNAVVSFASLILDTDRQRVWDEVQAALAQRQPYTLEYRIRHRSGRELWVWERGRGVFSDNGELLALEGIINDISERKWAEGKILQLGKMLDNANDAVSAVDEHFKLTYWNAAAERLYGWKKEEVLGKEIAEVVKIEFTGTTREEVRAILRTGAPWRGEVVQYARDGKKIHVEMTVSPIFDDTGRVVGSFGVNRDITERKRAEETLRKLSSAVEQTADAVFITNRDGIIEYVNSAFQQLTGYTEEEALGKTPRILKSGKQDQQYYETLWKTILSGKPFRSEIVNKKKNGEFYYTEQTITPIIDANGNITHFVSVCKDTTERRRAQQELERRHQTLQALSTVGRVLTSSLDLNHVLSAIVRSVSELFHTSATAVLLYDANAHRLSIAAQIGYDESLVSDLRVDVEREGITGLAVLRREPIYVPDVTKEPRYIKGAENVRSELALPLVVAGHIVGVLDVQDTAADAFDDDRIAVLAQFADYAAIAIENAQLYQQSLWRVKELFALNEVMRLSLARMTFEELAVSTAEMLSQQFAYDGVSVYAVVSDEEIRCLCRYLDGRKVSGEDSNLPIGQGIVGWVAREGVALIVNNTRQDARFIPCADIDARSELAVPIKLEGRVIAVLNIDSRKQNAFTNNDLAMVNTIAAQLSSAYERTRLVEQINASQRQYQNLYDNAPDMYQTLDEEGRILLCNETMAATLGYRKDELVGKHVVQFIPEELHPKVRETMKKVMTEGEVFDFESQLRTRNGTMIDVVVNARLDVRSEGTRTILATMRDVTEKKKKEFELMRLASIVSNSPDCVFITDRNGVIEYVNPAFEHTTGYTSAEVIGQTPRILKSGKHDRKFYETLWNTILDGKVWRGQFVNRKKNGELYYDERIIAPLRDAEGNIVNFIATGRDVTERKLLEEQLLQAQKLESVGTLASGIAHDFNNILNNIVGFAGQLKKHAHDPGKVLRYGETIDRSAQHGVQLTSQLLSFVRKKKREEESVDVSAVIDEVVSLCRDTFPKTITISTDVEAPLPLIKGTSGELYQVLLNMALNARDAMPNGGSLRIEAHRRAVGEEVHPKLFQISSNECVELLVVDTGTGIPFHLREKIFDPFFTTKEIGKGTGLGLSMAYTIVRNHGGSIVVESEENVGTTFHIYLPVQESSPSTTNAPSENTPRAGGSGELILLVDDEETMRTLGEELLTEAGFRVLLAEDGLQAIEMYRQHQNEIALVILDLLMPKMDGGMTYLELKKINPQVRAFFCTGHATEKVIAPLLEEENLRVLPKPFRPGALVNMVREVLEL